MDIERLEKLKQKFQSNEYEAVICASKSAACTYIAKLCNGKSVGLGDSGTIREIGLLEYLKTNSDELFACHLDKSLENKRKSVTADIFILSANAVAEDTAEMVNIDSSCNRVAGSLFGPKEVVFVIGRNKITPNLMSAIHRARNVAAPINAKAHEYKTPCVISGKCENCRTPDRICRATVIYHKRPKPMKTTIVLVDEDLGF